MRRSFLLIVLAVYPGAGLWAADSAPSTQNRHLTLVRRLTVVAACAASFWDAATTHTAVQAGALEGNPFLSGTQGKPRWGRMITIKAALCAGTAISQEARVFRNRAASYAWIATNTALAANFTALSIRNRQNAADLRRQAPAYLLAQQ